MDRFAWTVYNQTQASDQTSNVLSFSMTIGRQDYLQVYSGGALVLTIRNQADQVANFTTYDEIRLKRSDGSRWYSFWVTQIDYDDYPGNIGFSTATITCQDLAALLGRTQLNNLSLTETNIGNAWTALQSAPGINSSVQMTPYGCRSISAAQTISGSVLNISNLLNTTERGIIRQEIVGMADSTNRWSIYGRNAFSDSSWATSTYPLKREVGASQIGYQSFDRIGLGQTFMNQAQVTGTGLAVQQATNAASVTAYGAAGFTVSSVDYNTTQALGHAEWLANTLSDPNKLRYEIAFTDRQQSTSLITFNAILQDLSHLKFFDLSWRKPGAGADTTTKVMVEGMNIMADQNQSTFRLYLTDLTFYQFFDLNSTTFGVLNTSRLGW